KGTTDEGTVQQGDSNGRPDAREAAQAGGEAAVKGAGDAAQAGKDKKAEVGADGVVNPDEKSAVDGLNDVTTEKKGTATPLVDSLPEGPVKEALKARLDQVTTSEVTVNDADSNGKPDSQVALIDTGRSGQRPADLAAPTGKQIQSDVKEI
ncbi:GA-like domain-containing protein, partial [Streptococcus agalactiae]|uniref:GA-like domain-containing protein n=1 Tax=Streptococcus agalactiae TaxID=1311 RepID=UPI00387DC8C3